ncbi:hypothetical protein MOX02_43580 [Methylobacterium oxalidis]|uniref:Uncharacterized protein n=1 Tax=Methylobacterium oxalidis TaxID=944322 RepID=A0A512J8N3_9HYPH|nr:hypothetical protein MOX02_43580 [Methylobacterium oxalidis]GLS64369.1 hypothetical protein GCM10007888_27500 [Methylobacterium oxalidis]
MDRQPIDNLPLTTLYLAEGARRCDLQRAFIAYLRAGGHDTAAADASLVSFERALGSMREHHQRLRVSRRLP